LKPRWPVIFVIFLAAAAATIPVVRRIFQNRDAAATDWITSTPQATGEVTVSYDQFQNTTTASIGDIMNPQWRMLTGTGDGQYQPPEANSDQGVYACFEIFYKDPPLQAPPPAIYFQMANDDAEWQMDMLDDFFFPDRRSARFGQGDQFS
jgi:hypothetical protein